MPKREFIDKLDLPTHYDRTKLTLIPRDPYWVFAYWEIAQSALFEKSSYVIRMYDVTSVNFNGRNANSSFDVNISPHAGNLYINLPRDNVRYCAELGTIAPGGKFFQLAMSNHITVPRLNPSPNKIPLNPSLEKGERGGFKNLSRKAKRMFLTEDDIRAYYSKIMPLSSRKIKQQGRAGQPAAGHPAAGHPARTSEKIFSENRQKLQNNYDNGLNNIFREGFKNNFGGSSEGLISSGAMYQASSSARDSVHGGGRKFFFEIGTELIVYGRTEPDAEVRMNDKKIDLRSDGTFSLRFALPDGKIPLDFIAVSHDKIDKRAITTSVERTKTKTETGFPLARE